MIQPNQSQPRSNNSKILLVTESGATIEMTLSEFWTAKTLLTLLSRDTAMEKLGLDRTTAEAVKKRSWLI